MKLNTFLTSLLFLSLGLVVPVVGYTGNGPPDKAAVCHIDRDTQTTHIINISSKAVPAHKRHGDLVLPTTEAGFCNDGLDNDCNGLIDSNDAACGRVFKYVFVTSTLYTGDLKGTAADALEGADDKCNLAADAAAQIPGNPLNLGPYNHFTAWLSLGTNAKDRVPLVGASVPEYRLLDGVTVVVPLNGLVDYNNILSPINLSEQGTLITNFPWTNTENGISASSLNCTSFTSASSMGAGVAGDTTMMDARWSKASVTGGFFTCSSTRPLYCFEDQ